MVEISACRSWPEPVRTNYVVDASVIVALFVTEPASAAALEFVAQGAQADVALHAPDALFYESVGALIALERRGLAPADVITRALSFLDDFAVVVTPSRALARDAAQIARTHRVSAHDAFYLALAARVGAPRAPAPVITADARLVGATLGKGFDVRRIGPA